MPNNATVGILQARLTSDTAQFEAGMRRGKQVLDSLVLGMTSAGKQATDSARLLAGLGAAGRDAADAAEKLKRPLDAIALGMSAAGKEASATGRLISGM